MGARRSAREHALRMLYQAEIQGLSAPDTIRLHWEREAEQDDSVRAFAERLVAAALGRREEIDSLITGASLNWTLDRIGVVDRNILRVAIGEMFAEPATPAAVIIDEAVEIARDYGEADSRVFVNGVLEAVRKRLGRPPGAR